MVKTRRFGERASALNVPLEIVHIGRFKPYVIQRGRVRHREACEARLDAGHYEGVFILRPARCLLSHIGFHEDGAGLLATVPSVRSRVLLYPH